MIMSLDRNSDASPSQNVKRGQVQMHHSINTSLLQNQPQLGMINNETDQDGGSVNNIKLENQLNSQQSMQSLKDIDAIKNKATNFISEQLNLIQTKFV